MKTRKEWLGTANDLLNAIMEDLGTVPMTTGMRLNYFLLTANDIVLMLKKFVNWQSYYVETKNNYRYNEENISKLHKTFSVKAFFIA